MSKRDLNRRLVALEKAAAQRKLKSLTEFNADKQAEFERQERLRKAPNANGIACPECGKELWDTFPMVTLTSNPPQKNVHCPACGYKGYRIA